MISVVLLIITIILLAVGGLLGFYRGVLKQGIRTMLWGIVFAGSIFIAMQMSDKISLCAADLTWYLKDIVSDIFARAGLLKNGSFIIIPFIGMVHTLLIPFVIIVLFWISGLISWILYLIVAGFLRNKTENQSLGLKIAGMLVGLAVTLFAGAVTVYPISQISSAVQEGDYDKTLCDEFEIVNMVATSYEGSAVSLMYQFSGMEALSNVLHYTMINPVLTEEEYVIWTELPDMVRLGAEAWKTYLLVSGDFEETLTMQEQISRTIDAYFNMNIDSDETLLGFLKNIKYVLVRSLENPTASMVADWIEIESKEQVKNDIVVFGRIYDILKREGVLDAIINGTALQGVTEETGTDLIDTLYMLSNSEVVIPQAINLLYADTMSNNELQLILSDVEWTEETREELSEVVSLVSKMPDLLEQMDSLTTEEKEEVIDSLKALEDNKVINQEMLEELVNSFDGLHQ